MSSFIYFFFLHEFKPGHNASQTAANINKAWGKWSTYDWSESYWFQKFCRRDMNRVDQSHRGVRPIDDTNILKHLLTKTHIKVSEKCIRQWGSEFQQYWILSRKLAKWRNSINGFHMNFVKVKDHDILKYVWCCFCGTWMSHFWIE